MLKKDGLDICENFYEIKKEPNKNITGDTLEENLIKTFNNLIDSIRKKFVLLDKDIDEDLKLNILRGQVSLLLSAIDLYIHEILKIELLAIIKGERKRTKSLKNCMLSLDAYLNFKEAEDTNNTILEDEIILRNSFKSFLEPSKMAEVLSLITEKKIFKELYQELNFSKDKDLKEKMQEIYKRRNLIVHQMDYDYSNKNQYSLSKETVQDYIEFYERFIKALHQLLIQENI